MLCSLKTCTVSVIGIFPQFILDKIFDSFDMILPRILTEVYDISRTFTSSFLKDVSLFFSKYFPHFPSPSLSVC